MTVSISGVHIVVDDPDTALDFYRDGLGMTVRFEASNGGFKWITLGTESQPEINIVLAAPHAGRSKEDGDAVAALLAKGELTMVQLRTEDLNATFENAIKVPGVVTMDGKPLADAEVVFEPADKDQKLGGATARTDEQGKFLIQTSKQLTMKPGKYAVYISKWVDKQGKSFPPEEMEMQKAAGLAVNAVAAKFSNREQVPIHTADIKPGTNAELTFDVQSK